MSFRNETITNPYTDCKGHKCFFVVVFLKMTHVTFTKQFSRKLKCQTVTDDSCHFSGEGYSSTCKKVINGY